MLGKMFKSLFSSSGDGTKGKSKAVTADYDGFLIVAEPQPNNGQWQVSGRIEKQVGETTKVHTFIRADTLPDEQAAANEMIRKAKMMIDQMGESLFD
ncbi:HlyU family transcriptional regulator [Roseibium sediminicola]|uniref:HlyU family transcriptional regulator n=1 Tax=Roseibium sediminicola TaxID=2933272 RepID=A0ABT0GT20_9HYPH|nr:HlyU family transcriptional regulator [Roseibium sp. CAU 1639]MCK7612591.1 HlyU family transcriptional regulator [Roseibium sp. CAU 1639]